MSLCSSCKQITGHVWCMISANINPFAPEPPVTARADPCDVISFNGQGQLCLLTCAEWRGLSNHTRMGTIQSRIPEKTAKNHARLTCKSPWKSCSITHLPFLSPNPKILKAFLKTLPIKMKPTKCPAREKKSKKSKTVEILLSAHARTLQADILHLDQKAVKSTTGKRVCGKF